MKEIDDLLRFDPEMVLCEVFDVSFDPTAFLGPFVEFVGYDFSPGFEFWGREVGSFEDIEFFVGPPGVGGPSDTPAGVFVE